MSSGRSLEPGSSTFRLMCRAGALLPAARRPSSFPPTSRRWVPARAAIAAYRAAAGELERYPDGSATALREALAGQHGLNAERIVCGAGSDELLSLLAQAYLAKGDEAIHSAHGFLVYPIVIKASGATAVAAPETKSCGKRRCHSRQSISGDADGVSRQSEQPDRHLSAVQRGQAAAGAPAAAVPAGGRCRLCRIRAAQ